MAASREDVYREVRKSLSFFKYNGQKIDAIIEEMRLLHNKPIMDELDENRYMELFNCFLDEMHPYEEFYEITDEECKDLVFEST